MNTLDEVIKAFEECIVPKNVFCNGCYKDDRCKITEDALNYLKQYQRDKQIFSYDVAKKNMELSERNDPLSWDELKTLEGKPIWVELLKTSDWKGWDVVSGFTDDDDFGEFMVTVRDDYFKSEFGKTWNAYRKERE